MWPFPFTTLKRCLGTEDTRWWSVSGVIFSLFFLQTSLKVCNSTGSPLSHLSFKMRHTFSIVAKSGLHAGQSSTPTLFFCSHAFVMCAQCVFALSCCNMHGRQCKRCRLEGSRCCAKISMYFLALMVPSQKCKLPLTSALTQPHTMTDPGFWTCCWSQSEWSFSSLIGSTQCPFLPNNTWNTDLSDHSTRFHLVMVHPNSKESRERGDQEQLCNHYFSNSVRLVVIMKTIRVIITDVNMLMIAATYDKNKNNNKNLLLLWLLSECYSCRVRISCGERKRLCEGKSLTYS